MNLRVLGLLCAGYFSANLVWRWANFEFFSGHGAYGWPKPDTLQLLAMVLSVVSSALILFFAIPWALETSAENRLSSARAKKLLRGLLAATMTLAIVYAEMNNSWYALSREHLRYTDIAIFLESNPVTHFGLSTAQVAATTAAVVFHVPVLWGAYCGIVWFFNRVAPSAWPGLASRWMVLIVFVVIAAGFLVSLVLVRQKNDQWSAIARRNLYDLSAAGIVRYRHPDAQALDAIIASLRQRLETDGLKPKAVVTQGGVSSTPIKHILIIAIEGWNSRYFDSETMPFLSEVSRQSMTLLNHYSSGNNTLLGMTGLMFGQTPALFFEQRAIDTASEPVRIFRENGFSIRRFGHGLTSYRSIESYLTGVDEDADARSEKSTDSFSYIRQHLKSSERTLSIYYYGDTHYPYRHASAFSRFQPEIAESSTITSASKPQEIAKIVNRYRNTLNEADSHLRELFATIDWRSMLVVITGDHGESMMENGRLSHSSSLEQPQTRTPMLLYFPGVRIGAFQGISSHLDIMPTALHVAGLGAAQAMHGSSVLIGDAQRYALVAHNNQNSRPTRLAVIGARAKIVLDVADVRDIRAIDLMTPDDRIVRLPDIDRADVEQSLEFAVELFAASGCLGNIRDAAATSSPVPRLRHCRDDR